MPTPEIEQKTVVERPTEINTIPEEIEKAGVSPRPVQFKAQVKSDKGTNLIQTPQSKVISIQLPASQTQLADMSKGSTDDSSTWRARYWLRIVKKALHFGWQMVTGQT